MKTLTAEAKPMHWLDKLSRRAICSRLKSLSDAHLVIEEPWGEQAFGDPNAELRARIRIHDTEAWRTIALNGSVGAGEAYMTGDWDADDLPNLIRILARNQQVLGGIDGGVTRVFRALMRVWYRFQRNSEKGARRNIAAHYDLGNEMFELFLDPTMMYSSAIFPSAEASLEEASYFKLQRICEKLQLKPEDHLIEIGTGWGGMAIFAAKHYGCRVTTTTISDQQYDLAKQRVEKEGLQDKVTLLKQDYRQLEGQFDKLVSIEMIEAVGHQYLETYFSTLKRLLKPNGLALIQAITIEDQRYEVAKSNVDFIKRYIFPGGFLPSVTAIQNCLTKCTDMTTLHMEDIGRHYAETLRHWRRAFLSREQQLEQMGYNPTFRRMWDFYFSYCEGGFEERSIGTVQLVFARPGFRTNN